MTQPSAYHNPSGPSGRTAANLPLFSERFFRLLKETVNKVTGLHLSVHDASGTVLFEPAAPNSFCRYLRRDKKHTPLCASSDKYGLDQAFASRGCFIYFCPCGLIRAAVPIIHMSVCLGVVFLGHVRSDNAPAQTPSLKRLHGIDGGAAQQKRHHGELLEATPTYDFSYFTYIAGVVASVIEEAASGVSESLLQKQRATEEIRTLHDKIQKLEQEVALRESTILHLKNYGDPGYFINELSSVAALAAIEGAERTGEMCRLLADHLRYSFTLETGLIPLREEFRAVNTYLAVQKIRFGESLAYCTDLPEKLGNCRIPARTLLPFVAKTLQRGLAATDTGYSLSVAVSRHGSELTIDLQDNDGSLHMRDASPALGGDEVMAAVLRFDALLGKDHEINFSALPEGTLCSIRFTPPFGEGGE